MIGFFGENQTVNIFIETASQSQDVDLSDYEYTLDGTVATLTKYIGSDADVITPSVG